MYEVLLKKTSTNFFYWSNHWVQSLLLRSKNSHWIDIQSFLMYWWMTLSISVTLTSSFRWVISHWLTWMLVLLRKDIPIGEVQGRFKQVVSGFISTTSLIAPQCFPQACGEGKHVCNSFYRLYRNWDSIPVIF